jgi:hypothetical protein
VRAIRFGTVRGFFRLDRFYNQASFRYLYTDGCSHREAGPFEPTALET